MSPAGAAQVPALLSVQLGAAQRVKMGGRTVLTAFNKQAVEGDVVVAPLGLLGDEQADLSIHGGLEKAIYAYPWEHRAFWQKARQDAGASPLGEDLAAGFMGENLTLQGLLETEVWAGDVLQFASCALKVTIPREPCFKLNAALGFSRASRLMAESGYCGFYLSVLTPGSLRAGESFNLIAGRRGVSIPELFAAKLSKHLR